MSSEVSLESLHKKTLHTQGAVFGKMNTHLKDMLQEILMTHLRTPEALRLAEHANGKIVLRSDGKIDFPEIGLKGVCRLNSSSVTDFSDPKKILVQGDYVDRMGKQGNSRLAYMSGCRAREEAAAQGLCLLPEREVHHIQLLQTFGVKSKEQLQALRILFGNDFSGYWHPVDEVWQRVGDVSYLGLFEIGTDACVRDVNRDRYDRSRGLQSYPQPFLVCESY